MFFRCLILFALCLACTPASADVVDVVVGEMHVTRVVDGDTIWVDGLTSSLRLLGIDTEETFKTDGDRRAYAKGWTQYSEGKRAEGARPAKYATPLGEDAKHWAQAFFQGVDRVRIERDDPEEIRDRYDRYLAYVFAYKHGAWVLYNVECVRAGMAPYFTKYGRSRRFDADFIAAEAEAKKAQRGIWATGVRSYPDYDEREAWWNARGDFVAKFRAAAADPAHAADYIDITHEDALRALAAQAKAGNDVTVLGTVGDLHDGDKAPRPVRVMLSRHAGEDLPVVIFDRDVYARSGLAHWKGEFVTVRGRPTIYKQQVELVVDSPKQIMLSPVPGLTP